MHINLEKDSKTPEEQKDEPKNVKEADEIKRDLNNVQLECEPIVKQ